MAERRFNIRTGRRIVPVAVLLLSCSALSALAQLALAPQTGRSASTRACSANPVLVRSASKKKASQKSKNPLPSDPAPACIEVKGQPIEVQEFLQNTAREQAWRIGENRASEDTWSFVRYLDPQELEKFADTKVLVEPVEFADGKAAVNVRTTDIGEGYTRVQVSAQIQGEGKSTDKVSAQPATVWPLNSKGILEQDLLKALQTGYKPLE
jgi:hypothetical protein